MGWESRSSEALRRRSVVARADLIATASVALLEVSAEERVLELRQFVVQRKRRELTRSLTASNSFEVHLTRSDAIPTR